MMESTERRREFAFGDRDFAWIQRTVKERVGINLTDAKRDMVYNRLTRVLRRRGLDSIGAFLARAEADDAALLDLINAVTTNVTHFFREDHHFERLAATLPEIVDRHRADRRIRVWSAGCSTGEEAYSIAITLEESLPTVARGDDVLVLASDLDTNVLATASAGVYPASSIENLSAARRKRWFRRGRGANEGTVRVDDALKRRIRFRRLNLMDPWPMGGGFDVIFCRNVVIYFDKPTQRRLFARFAEQLRPGGLLFVGHSETLTGGTDAFEFVGQSSYRRTAS